MRLPGLPLLVCLFSLAPASCGPSGVAAKAAKAPELDVKGQAKCGVTKSRETPLIIEWPDDARVRLERAVAGRMVAVRYEGCDMQLVRGCTVKGSAYRYAPVTPKRSQVVIRSEDDLYAKLPIGAVGLEGKLRQSGQLTVDMLMVGRFETETARVDRSALEGACEGATHVVTGLTVGAFHFFAGAGASASASVEAGIASGGGKTSAARETLNQDGNAAACEKSSAGDATPPYGCSAPMVVEVMKIADARAAPPAPPAAVEPGAAAPAPAGPGLDPYGGRAPAPHGTTPAPYGEAPRPYGGGPSPYEGRPYGAQGGGGASSLGAAGMLNVAALGGGILGAVVTLGGLTGVSAQRKIIDDECSSETKTCSPEGLKATKSYVTWAWVTNAGLGVLAGSALLYYLVPHRSGAAATSVSAGPLPGGGALHLGRSF